MKPIHYHDYLKLDDLLSSQSLRSDEEGRHSHDEMLFIITHQTYELWFKQLIYELDSVLDIFTNDNIEETSMGLIVSRVDRMKQILKVLLSQIDILETMTPLDFLDFRDLLYPASGFQSFQFRVFENKLGLQSKQRISYNHKPYNKHFRADQDESLKSMEKDFSLFDCIEKWLERTPFLDRKDFDFWAQYQSAVHTMFDQEHQIIKNNALLGEIDKERNFLILKDSQKIFEALFNQDQYQELQRQNLWRLSYRAIHASLLIQLHRDEPIFQLPFRLLTGLLDLDETLTQWRYKHALLARRMLGTKVGTGGSSGSKYLQQSTEQHKIFSDFFQLTTFFIPRSRLPNLPESFKKDLGFYYKAEL